MNHLKDQPLAIVVAMWDDAHFWFQPPVSSDGEKCLGLRYRLGYRDRVEEAVDPENAPVHFGNWVLVERAIANANGNGNEEANEEAAVAGMKIRVDSPGAVLEVESCHWLTGGNESEFREVEFKRFGNPVASMNFGAHQSINLHWDKSNPLLLGGVLSTGEPSVWSPVEEKGAISLEKGKRATVRMRSVGVNPYGNLTKPGVFRSTKIEGLIVSNSSAASDAWIDPVKEEGGRVTIRKDPQLVPMVVLG